MSVDKADGLLSPQVEGTVTALNSATSSAPSSQWRRPAKSTGTVSNR